jgi:anti-sigma factor RsiW
MTCTEARRLLPAPEGPKGSPIEAHLATCAPCRSEAESLREVDRRLVRLGQARAQIAVSQRGLLDEALAQQLGPAGSFPLRRLLQSPVLWALLLMAASLTALWLRLRHR